MDISLPNSRQYGYSLRRSLIEQGVTTEEGIREHLAFVYSMPVMDITRYRVNPATPNVVYHG